MENNDYINDEQIKTDDKVQDTNKSDPESDLKKDDKKGPNYSKKNHITNLGSKIESTEKHLEEMNRSIMGDSIFDY